MTSVKSTLPIRSAIHESDLVPGTRDAHRASAISETPMTRAIVNFASPGKPKDGIERMVYQI